MIKSSVRIIDSDEDEDDEDFFAREKDLRMRMAQRAEAGELPSSGTKKVAKKKGKKPPETPRKDVWVVDSPKEGSVMSDVVTLDTENDENVDLGINDDDSENGDVEAVRPAKKRMVRRALSISSDDE
jgi:hypothetical protein